MAGTDIEKLEGKCYCGGIHFTFDVPKTELPLDARICHCSICRFALGAPASFHADFPKDLRPQWIAPSSPSNMKAYSPPGACFTLNFCATCGCHVGAVDIATGEWTAATAIFNKHGLDTFKLNQHVFSKSSRDEGLAALMTHIGSSECKSWNPEAGSPAAQSVELPPEVGPDGRDRLRAQCHCGGVSFTIQRPTKEVLENEDSKYKEHLVAPGNTKWFGDYDACDDCRLVTGTPIIAWTFVPFALLEPPIGPDLKHGALKTYESSPGILRAFCATCSATVFFRDPKRKLGDMPVVDIANGILRAQEGAMAANWLTWRPKVEFLESGLKYDRDMIQGIQDGLKKWVAKNQAE